MSNDRANRIVFDISEYRAHVRKDPYSVKHPVMFLGEVCRFAKPANRWRVEHLR